MLKRVKLRAKRNTQCVQPYEYESTASIFQFNNWKLSNGPLDGEAFIYLGLSGHLRVYNPFFTYVIASLKHHFPLSLSLSSSPDFHCGKSERLDTCIYVYIYMPIASESYSRLRSKSVLNFAYHIRLPEEPFALDMLLRVRPVPAEEEKFKREPIR